LAGLGRETGAAVFRGSSDDLVDRYYQAARAFGAATIVRLPADNPVPEPEEIDRIVRFFHEGGVEFASNLAQVLGNAYPDGIGAEVFSLDSLTEVWRTCDDPERREHPHLSFFNYKTQTAVDPARFRVGTVPCPEAFRRPDLVLDVNTREEYEFMAALYAYLYPRNPRFHITDIVRWYDQVYRAG
jgi:spore coat polysaccharide biosynthesis protein SpsF